MLYVIYGQDNYRSREKFKFLADYFLAKTGEDGLIRMTPEEATSLKIEEASRSASLFSKKHVVLIERWFEEERQEKEMKRLLKMVSESPNIFIFWEEEIEKEILEYLEKFAEKIENMEFLPEAKLLAWINERASEVPMATQKSWIKSCGKDLRCLSVKIENFVLGGEETEEKKNNKSPFILADAILGKRKGEAWLTYQREILKGVNSEDLFWDAWWQVKTLFTVLRMVSDGFSEGEIATLTGIKPYPVKKSLNALRLFKKGEIEKLSQNFVRALHESRRGNMALNIAFERILLEI